MSLLSKARALRGEPEPVRTSAVSPSGLDAAALLDAYAERVAICTADGIPEAEAIRTAEAEIGAEAIRRLLDGKASEAAHEPR